MGNVCANRTIINQLSVSMQEEKQLLATAESCTGGGISEKITSLPGSSKWFDRGFVTYSNTAKEEMLSVDPKTLLRFGAVSEKTAKEMAEGAIKHSQAQLSVAVTGIAGPDGGTKEKPVGTVWIAWAGGLLKTRTDCFHFKGDRASVRAQTIQTALEGVYIRLKDSLLEKKKGRYFFALWPDDDTREKIADITRQLPQNDNEKMTIPPNLHLTLSFLGSVSEDFIRRAASSAKTIKSSPIKLDIDGMSDFSHGIRYLTIKDKENSLKTLQANLNRILIGEGFRPERRAFVPHITIVRRLKETTPPPSIKPIAWAANRFYLVRTHPDRDRKYEIIKTFKL